MLPDFPLPRFTARSRVAAVLTEPDAAKAATLTPAGEMAFFSFPIEKVEDGPDGEITVIGKATDGSLDSDLQIVDPAWSEKALREWFDTGANVRVQHQAQRDPAGKGTWLQGHQIRARVIEPVAVKLVRAGVLQDFSVGIMNPDVRVRDPRFAHLDPQGKAVNGVITGRDDGLSKIGEVSLVDRGSNFSTKFAMLKAAADGSPEWVGTLTAPDAVLAKVSAPRTYKTVSVDLPAGMRIKVSPAQLAKMNTMAQRNAVAAGTVTKVAEPGAPKAAGEPDYADVYHKLEEVAPLVIAQAEALKAVGEAEDAVLGKGSRTFTAEQRREHASEGTALADGSYPMPDADAVRRAAILIRSKHGKWQAAEKLLGRRAKALGIPNPLKKKPKADKAAAAVCDVCKDSGTADGKPCTSCAAGAKAAEALVAKAAAGFDGTPPPGVTKKTKVMCGHCGAKQNSKHVHCPECGNSLSPGAMPVAKNHDFTCLGCGKDLDKGEPHCPQCGRENPGYLPEADHKIPANKAAKERVSTDSEVTKAAKGKKAKAKVKGKKGKKSKPFGGNQAPAFGPDGDGKNDDAEAQKAVSPAIPAEPAKAVKRRKGKGKGKSPAVGAVPQHTDALPPHREPDGPPVEMFEQDTHLTDGDERAELAASIRHKSLGIDPQLAVLHDLACPAFSPASVSKTLPAASFAGIDDGVWQSRALEAASGGDMATAMARWNEMSALSRHALTLKAADPQLLADLRTEHHAAFRAANEDALKALTGAAPGPGSFPTPAHLTPGQFRRPYISAGHAAPSPQHGGPHAFPAPEGTPAAVQYQRDYITAGHAADSPANDTPRHMPQPAPREAGQPSRVFYQNTIRDNARAALNAMHDHIAHLFPDICAMSPPLGETQKPAPPVPAAVGGPVPHTAGKTAKPGARKAAARKAKRKAAQKRRRTAVTKSATVTPLPVAAPDPAAAPIVPVPAPLHSGTDAEMIAQAVKTATRPLIRGQRAQDKRLRQITKTADAIAKTADAIANQSDTSAAPFRGAGVAKSATMTSPAPAVPVTAAQSAELAQTAKMQRLWHEWRTNNNPEYQEAAWQELQAMLGTQPMTGYGSGLTPMQRLPQT